MKVKVEFAVGYDSHTWQDCNFKEVEVPDEVIEAQTVDEYLDIHATQDYEKEMIGNGVENVVFVHLYHWEFPEEEEAPEPEEPAAPLRMIG